MSPRPSTGIPPARGLKPGPHYRSILLALRNAWLDGEVTNAEQEAELLDKFIVESTEH